jgi:hypothetical protein
MFDGDATFACCRGAFVLTILICEGPEEHDENQKTIDQNKLRCSKQAHYLATDTRLSNSHDVGRKETMRPVDSA